MADPISVFLKAAKAGNLEKVIEYLDNHIVDVNSCNSRGLTALHSASDTDVVRELIKRGADVMATTQKGNTPLHINCLAGNEDIVRILIQHNADVNKQSLGGFSPLYMAAQENHQSIVRLLLANGANQNLATTEGFTPLAVAMQQGHDQVASILLGHGTRGKIRFPVTSESGRSLLHIAAKKDDCAAAALLLQSNISPDVTSKNSLWTALHVACHYGNENIARLLIERQADINAAAKQNITPLHVAARWGHRHMVQLLLDYGAKIDAKTTTSMTPTHVASRNGHEAVVDLLITRGAPLSARTRSGLVPLHLAAQGDHHDVARVLLHHRAPVDEITNEHITPLHVASHCGHVRVAKLLLDHNADPNFRALNQFTSLHIACKKNRLAIVELLLRYGAQLNAVTESGLTGLMVAAFMGHIEIVLFLLRQQGADCEAATVRGETALLLAVRANQLDVVSALLRHGAALDARTRESQNALHIAARLNYPEMADLLLRQGNAPVDATTRELYQPLAIAAKEGHEQVARVLLAHGANIECSTRNHQFRPLHLASKYGHVGMCQLLLDSGAQLDAQGKNQVTPLMVATHYDQLAVAQLLLARGASPHSVALNRYTSLHIAAKNNRLDIARALLAHQADVNSQSKAKFRPLHLAAKEGHQEMVALLIGHGADINCRARNGIAPIHLCAEGGHVPVAQLLFKPSTHRSISGGGGDGNSASAGADLDAQTKGGYSALMIAAFFGQPSMAQFLLANGCQVNLRSASNHTALHLASQQNHHDIVQLLLRYHAEPDVLTDNQQTALSIAQNLGHVSIVDTLRVVTETVVKTTTKTITEEKFKLVAPETMQETFDSDSEDEATEDTKAHAESVKFLTTDHMKGLMTEQPGHAMDARRDDDMSQDMTYLSNVEQAPLDAGESTIGVADYAPLATGSYRQQVIINDQQQPLDLELERLSPDNVDLDDDGTRGPPVHAGFLVSFMVDARGGAMRGCRHSGVRVIIPPKTAQQPMRITCRYLRKEKLVHPPPLMEGEACASKIMEVGPSGAKFLGPVLIEVPHFASLRGREREIIILRSENGEVWREHLVDQSSDDATIANIMSQLKQYDNENNAVANDNENIDPSAATISDSNNRITRIVTNEFPKYFAIITRVRQQVHVVGTEGGTITSNIEPKVQAIFPEGALTKRIKVGLQSKRVKRASSPDSNKEKQEDTSSTGADDEQEEVIIVHDLGQFDDTINWRSTTPGGTERPSSASAKRCSRFLTCFMPKGSVELLNEIEPTTQVERASSPTLKSGQKDAQVGPDTTEADALEALDSHTSDGEQPDSLSSTNRMSPLVADDYYIEREPALILNSEPKTYGKRLKNQSAQTDQRMINATKYKPSRSRKNKQSNKKAKNNKSVITVLTKRSADDTDGLDKGTDADEISIIQDVITSADQKWRTCTIQTDDNGATGGNFIRVGHVTVTTDDGYCSENGDLSKQGTLSKAFGKKSTGKEAKKNDKKVGKLTDVKSIKVTKAPKKDKSSKKDKKIGETNDTTTTDTKIVTDSGTDAEQQMPVVVDAKQEKQRLKLERQEKARQEKLAKRREKEAQEQQETEAKAAKLKLKQEKNKGSTQLAAAPVAPTQEPQSKDTIVITDEIPGGVIHSAKRPDTSASVVATPEQPTTGDEAKEQAITQSVTETSKSIVREQSSSNSTVVTSDADGVVGLDEDEKTPGVTIDTTKTKVSKRVSLKPAESGDGEENEAGAEVVIGSYEVQRPSLADASLALDANKVKKGKKDSDADKKTEQEAAKRAKEEAKRLAKEAKKAAQEAKDREAREKAELKMQAKLEAARLKAEKKAQEAAAKAEAKATAEAKKAEKKAKESAPADETIVKSSVVEQSTPLEIKSDDKTVGDEERKLDLKDIEQGPITSAEIEPSKIESGVDDSAVHPIVVTRDEDQTKPVESVVARKPSSSASSSSSSGDGKKKDAKKATKKKDKKGVQLDTVVIEDSQTDKEPAKEAKVSKKKDKKDVKPYTIVIEDSKTDEEPAKESKVSKKGDKKAKKEPKKPKDDSKKDSSPGFFSRLFATSKSKSVGVSTKIADSTEAKIESKSKQQSGEMPTVSEMYFAGPDEDDMILEVNVPSSVLDEAAAAKRAANIASARQESVVMPGDQEEPISISGPLVSESAEHTTSDSTTVNDLPTTTTDGVELSRRQRSIEMPSTDADQGFCGDLGAKSTATVTITDATEVPTSDDLTEATTIAPSHTISSRIYADDDDATEMVTSEMVTTPVTELHSTAESQISARVAEQQQREPRASHGELRIRGGDLLTRPDDKMTDAKQHIITQVSPPAESMVEPRTEAPQQLPSPPVAGTESTKEQKKRLKREAQQVKNEAKLRAKEDKKRAKEEEKRAKLAASEAKKARQQEADAAKRLAKEEKKLKELESKHAKEESKKRKLSAKEPVSNDSGGGSSSAAQVVIKQTEPDTVAEDQKPHDDADTNNESTASKTTVVPAVAANENRESNDVGDNTVTSYETSDERLTDGTPASEAVTRVERKSEEMMNDDGTLTKLTQTTETRLVTTRRERVQIREIKRYPDGRVEEIVRWATPDDEPQIGKSDAEPAVVELHRLDEGEQQAPLPIALGKKELRMRFKELKKARKTAEKEAKIQSKRAKDQAKLASIHAKRAEKIAILAQVESESALKYSRKSLKKVEKQHKKMDKTDKKLTKMAKKLDKKQRKLDKVQSKAQAKQAKRDAKLAKKAAKKDKERAKKEAKSKDKSKSGSKSQESRKASSNSGSHITIDQIGAPIPLTRRSVSQERETETVEPVIREQAVEPSNETSTATTTHQNIESEPENIAEAPVNVDETQDRRQSAASAGANQMDQ